MKLKDAKILVVDDELYFREIATEWLEREGCRIVAAEDGLKALQCLENSTFDAILTDIRMPVMDGSTLLRQLKGKGRYTPTAISISGFSDLSPREAYDLGIESQLSKPVSRKVLIATLEQALLDREELWALPFHPGKLRAIDATFESLTAAIEQELIAFGRGGFCLRVNTPFPEESMIGFQLSFESDQTIVAGQAVIRWVAPKEEQVGIEVSRVSARGRSWLMSITRENRTVSFIPRSAACGSRK